MSASDLEDLYREIILDHYRRPRHKGEEVASPSCSADGANPLCGDEIHLQLRLDPSGTCIEAIGFTGSGCSISQASASMMAAYVQGGSVQAALEGVEAFQRMMVTGESAGEEYGDIEALVGVAKFPVRVKCASLAWKTLEQALRRDGMSDGDRAAAPVSTDERNVGHE